MRHLDRRPHRHGWHRRRPAAHPATNASHTGRPPTVRTPTPASSSGASGRFPASGPEHRPGTFLDDISAVPCQSRRSEVLGEEAGGRLHGLRDVRLTVVEVDVPLASSQTSRFGSVEPPERLLGPLRRAEPVDHPVHDQRRLGRQEVVPIMLSMCSSARPPGSPRSPRAAWRRARSRSRRTARRRHRRLPLRHGGHVLDRPAAVLPLDHLGQDAASAAW